MSRAFPLVIWDECESRCESSLPWKRPTPVLPSASANATGRATAPDDCRTFTTTIVGVRHEAEIRQSPFSQEEGLRTAEKVLLARFGGTAAGGQEAHAIVEAQRDLLHGEYPHPYGCQLDRE